MTEHDMAISVTSGTAKDEPWLVRCVRKNAVAGFTVSSEGKVIRCAPILRKTIHLLTGRSAIETLRYRGWKCAIFPVDPDHGKPGPG